MTIKEFARLCGCNPQTLRYYDHVNLLRPVKVDQWSGYRYYEEEQALDFVKIKNLQKAGFAIDEIKELLDKDNRVIYRAFDAKIAEEEKRLQEIKSIQKSYQTEMNDIQKKIREVREKLTRSMEEYDPYEEFGITPEQYEAVMDSVRRYFEAISENAPGDIGYREFDDGNAPEEEREYLDLLNDPAFCCVYEKHGWERVRDFFDECCRLVNGENGSEYALVFRVDPQKRTYTQAFGNTVLGILMARDPEKMRSLSCNMEESKDGQNHFWLLKRK